MTIDSNDFEHELRATLIAAERAAPVPAGLAARLARAQPSRPRSIPRFVLRGVGQTLVSVGVIVLLFVGYEVYVTNYFTHVAQAAAKRQLVTTWKDAPKDPLLPLPGGTGPAPRQGKGIAFLYVPRLGRDYSWAVVEGVSDADLDKGPGHYPGTALPGQVGNFAVAGHRVGKGEPFLNLDHLEAGDPVIIQTESQWFIYRVKGQDHDNLTVPDADDVAGREIVHTADGAVLDPVPNHPGQTPTEALLTLTTCHPKFTAQDRMVVHAVLTQTVAAVGLRMPAAVRALYGARA